MSKTEEFPSREQIEARAYELYVERGRIPGREEEDWLAAENELRRLMTDKDPSDLMERPAEKAPEAGAESRAPLRSKTVTAGVPGSRSSE